MSQTLKTCFISVLLVASSGILSCARPQSKSNSSLSVTNSSAATSTEFQAVVKLLRQEGNQKVICTGSFIGKAEILTAAHCVGNSDPSNLYVEWITEDLTTTTIQATSIAIHPKFILNGKAIQPNDLAVVSVDVSEITSPSPISVSHDPILIGSAVTLVGYGNNYEALEDGEIAGTGAGDKRIGENRIYTSTRSGLVIVSGDPGRCSNIPGNSATGNGDSGGPLISNGQILGIALGGGILPSQSGDSCPKAISYFANLQLDQNLQFIADHTQ